MVISSVIQETWFYALTWVLAGFAIMGNLVVIAVHHTSLALRSSVTSVFIRGLSWADMLAGASLIPGMIGKPRVEHTFWGDFYCKIIGSYFFLWTSAKASIVILVFATSERYFSVVHPIYHRRYFTTLNAKLLVLLAWALAVVINVFSLFVLHAKDGTCIVEWKDGISEFRNMIGITIFVVSFFIPFTMMFLAYIKMFVSLGHREKQLNRTGPDQTVGNNVRGKNRDRGQSNSQVISHRIKRNIIAMLFIVVCTFTVCWAPDQICYLLMNLGVQSFDYEKSSLYPYFVLLAIANSCANPVIYSFKNRPFKKAMFKMITRKNRIRDSGSLVNSNPRNMANGIAVMNTISQIPREIRDNTETQCFGLEASTRD